MSNDKLEAVLQEEYKNLDKEYKEIEALIEAKVGVLIRKKDMIRAQKEILKKTLRLGKDSK
jgi:hypothetical protein